VQSFVLVLLTIVLVACSSPRKPHEVAPSIDRILSGKPIANVAPAVWTDVRAFYTQRDSHPAWADNRRPTARAADAIAVLNTARQHGFDAADYGTAELLAISQRVESIDKDSQERLDTVAEFDVRLTGALLSLARDVAIGRSRDAHRQPQRKAPDYVAALLDAANGDVEEWIDAMRPPHPEYAALQKALDALHGQEAKGGWIAVPATLKPGAAGAAVTALRQRLAMSGQLKGDPAASANYDKDVVEAVKAFQELHAIKATGVVDRHTLAAMNVPLDVRIRQVALNLQRWREMPDDLGERHFMVNVPYFHLIAREGGKPVMDIRVVVGTTENKTPLFSEEMESVVFSPYWNIPDSIAQGETLPAIARDPSYLSRQNIEILRVSSSGSQPVSPDDVDWDDPEALKEFAFRQKPGSGNALGHVKFLFPNPHNVYLHDTPADNLFGKPTRAFSHGCVRVEEPEVLAKYVLRDSPEWDEQSIGSAMHSGVEKHVKLAQKIPVHIVYFTAWVDENGGLHFQPDIYGYDRALARRESAELKLKVKS
jgi:murein L,D-transpeptidase YcbB/YkuD